MVSLELLRPILRAAWGADTCDPADLDDWRPENPARGQCGVTSAVVQDLLGGELVLGEVFANGVRIGWHYWNRLPSGDEVDFTADQFGPGEVVVGGAVQERPPGPPRRCRAQYELLRDRVLGSLEFIDIVRSSTWLLDVLRTVRDADLPQAWVGAGVLRDLVWGERHGDGFAPERVRDVDVAFFDQNDLSRANDERVTAVLRERSSLVPWQARNQAAVHLWYHTRFGGEPVEPLTSIGDAVATWPETATAVAVRLGVGDTVEVCAPYGLTDLLAGVWRRTPRRITVQQSQERLNRHQPALRWPGVTVIAPQ
jgi:hypothetical protein